MSNVSIFENSKNVINHATLISIINKLIIVFETTEGYEVLGGSHTKIQHLACDQVI